ncbi:hypothetical protein PF007_g15364 [Phytophthora fragariae]|uniref:Uncharacterized protein n=1 Tax=Phytophthora fragariae TaxID=53985 RepID=A0A6A3F943_9STRA|nr:hypothetical protein PF003_g38330 [Phytophthora fragariae]KAE8941803.1 hypothetical protein PF009_g8408 [Phytophthora fragariae]KAE9001338.1 hypothetical protein PF011_g13789 [Phytophthora fragariae]KAE9100844.1 hypothetical protein PF007_g15364 [Phytophthora fragariae]KAE9137542.1 hypothetical protein PF006_g14155 [Phytophthora fragariae]
MGLRGTKGAVGLAATNSGGRYSELLGSSTGGAMGDTAFMDNEATAAVGGETEVDTVQKKKTTNT